MTNTKLLREKIDASGLKLQYIADQLGITRFGLYKKLQDGSEFKPSQIVKLCELLRIETAEEREQIFFNLKVHIREHRRTR